MIIILFIQQVQLSQDNLLNSDPLLFFVNMGQYARRTGSRSHGPVSKIKNLCNEMVSFRFSNIKPMKHVQNKVESNKKYGRVKLM
jgi:hypothetical protein